MEDVIKQYLRGDEDQCLVQLITGERGSGKTTLLMKEMKWGLDSIPNLKVLFVCPVFKYEKHREIFMDATAKVSETNHCFPPI